MFTLAEKRKFGLLASAFRISKTIARATCILKARISTLLLGYAGFWCE